MKAVNIENIANNLALKMSDKGIIRQEEQAYYIYELILFIEKWITISSLIIIGIAFDKLPYVITFTVFFYMLRIRTGGYHASSFLGCYLLSTFVLVIVMWIQQLIKYEMQTVYICVCIAYAVIMLVGTHNHQDLHLNEAELRMSKRYARYTVSIEFFIIVLLEILGICEIYVQYMCMAIIVCACSLLVAMRHSFYMDNEDDTEKKKS